MLRVETEDGWALALERFAAPERPRGVVWLGHAMMANRSSLDRPRGAGLASRLAQRGFQVYTADLRGHGESAPRPAEGGSYRYEDLVLRDLPAITRAVSDAHASLPLAVVGHSLVGHAMLAWLGQADATEQSRVSAVVSVAGNVWLPDFERSRARWALKWSTLQLWPILARRRGYWDARRRRTGSDDVSLAYIQDFARWARTGRWDTVDGTDLRAGLSRVRGPVLSVAGRGDRQLCSPESAHHFMAELRSAQVTEWVVGRESGLDFDPGHMQLVTDPRSKPLWNDIATWLDQHLPQV